MEEIFMEKTKLGVTISLLGGALYFIGLMGITPLVIAAGYVLVMEENQWLKRVAVKAVAVVLFFAILSNVVSLAADSSSFLNTLVLLFNGTINLLTLNRIISLIRISISFLSTLSLLILGFKAMKMSDIGIISVDKAIDKNR